MPGADAPPPPPVQPPRTYTGRRVLLSLAVAVMGIIDLLSALLSHPPERLVALERLVPTEVLDSSRTFTLLAGSLLLVTAWGLRRGKRRAFVAALFLCALSVPVNLFKAFDVEEATVASALMFALGVSSEAFRVRSRELSFVMLRSRALWAVAGLLVYVAIGSWALEVHFGMAHSFADAFADAFTRLFGVGDPGEVPAHLARAQQRLLTWYLGSLPLLALTLAVTLALASLRPARHRRRHRAEAERVEQLLRDHGASSIAWFALDDDADYFFSRNERAVIAYRFESDALLVIGDPVGPAEELGPLLVEFAEFCRRHDWPFAFFQARPERLRLYESLGWRALHIGEDPVLWTNRFTLDGAAMSQVRRAVRKAEAAGLTVVSSPAGEDPFEPGAGPPGFAEELRDVSDDWLRARHGGEKGFCMGRFDANRLRDVWLLAAWNPAARRVEAFTTWVPIPARLGWALDLGRRRQDGAAGAMDLLVVRAVQAARERGDAMLSLSLSALAMVPDERACDDAPPASTAGSERAREFLMQHLAQFYDFKGLFRWKRRFDPAFEDRYLVYPAALALPRVALALIRAQSPAGLRSYLPWVRAARNAAPDVAASPVADADATAGGDEPARAKPA
ncbi:MAG TPA: phosphatidylglycerol lysyltransferase domain-containing protein [Methylomirabilota bacterium]|nr:phosphatidylglycerol lysyltransferase domain-containing protein [Methylomirabilota bacterium]